MEWLLYVVATIFLVFGAICVALVAISLPGTWLILGAAVLIELLDFLYLPSQESSTFGWWLIGVCVLIGLFGELLEFLAGALGAKFGGGTKRGMAGAIVGGIIGGIGFTLMLPIPIVGTLVGALVGTFIGAIVGEVTAVQAMSVRGSLRPATGATIGRVLGAVGKAGVAVVIWLALGVAAFL